MLKKNSQTLEPQFNKNYIFLLFPLMIFLPKIDIISIKGYYQGIRLEDIILFIYFISVFKFSAKFLILQKNFYFKPGLYLFIYLIFSNWIAILNGTDVKIIMMIRLFEYIILLYFVNNFKINKKEIHKIITIYIFANFIVSIFQYYGVLGTFSSRGYEKIDNVAMYGLAGGSWELGILLTLSFFIMMKNTNNILRDYILFVPIIYFQIFLSDSFTSIIASGLVFLFYLPKAFKEFLDLLNDKQKIIFIIILISFNIIGFLILGNFYEILVNAIPSFDYKNFIKLLTNFILFNEFPPIYTLDASLFSLYHRLESWQIIVDIFLASKTNILFGTGFTEFVYLDSTYVRAITGFGLVGTFLILISILKLNLYYLIYLLIIGISFDIFVSFKIVLFFLILVRNFDDKKSIFKTQQ